MEQDQPDVNVQTVKEEVTTDMTGFVTPEKLTPFGFMYQQNEKKSDEETPEIPGNGVSVILEMIEIPEDCVGLVIGKGGTKIKAIQGNTGCVVQMASPSAMVGYRQVTLQGAKHQIEHAKSLITDVVTSRNNATEQNNNGFSFRSNSRTGYQSAARATHGHLGSEVITVNVLIPKENCGSIIGKSGKNIKNLQEKLGVKLGLIQSTKDPVGPKPLEITGFPNNVFLAHQYITQHFVMHIPQGAQTCAEATANWPQLQHPQIQPTSVQAQALAPYQMHTQQIQQTGMQMGQTQIQPTSVQAQALAPYQMHMQQIQQTGMQMSQTQPQIDYTYQWIRFYQECGMHDEASKLEQRYREQQAAYQTSSFMADHQPIQPPVYSFNIGQ